MCFTFKTNNNNLHHSRKLLFSVLHIHKQKNTVSRSGMCDKAFSTQNTLDLPIPVSQRHYLKQFHANWLSFTRIEYPHSMKEDDQTVSSPSLSSGILRSVSHVRDSVFHCVHTATPKLVCVA